MTAAVPAIERALEIYERNGRSLAHCLRMRSLLVMSCYLFDHKLAARYGEDTLDALYPFTGLAEVERWSRVLGKHLGFALGMGWAMLRWYTAKYYHARWTASDQLFFQSHVEFAFLFDHMPRACVARRRTKRGTIGFSA
jgi:hypothetical protein